MRHYTPRGSTFEERLALSIEVADCWEWSLYCLDTGYGQVRLPDRTMLAHRWVWENLVGPVPDGLDLDHLCRNHPCVNPDHLEPVTRVVNLSRGFRNARIGGPCVKGHDPKYRHRYPSGQTRCLECSRKPAMDIRPIR